MQKVIGSIMVIAVCTMLGFEKSRDMQKHLNALEELKRIFVLLKSEVQYTRAPFAELFLKISKKVEGEYSEWLFHLSRDLETYGTGTLQEAWKRSIYNHLHGNYLKKEELDELCGVGKSLGYIETLEIYLDQLNFSIENTREELKTKKKLYQIMGIMSGIFLVIVLL